MREIDETVLDPPCTCRSRSSTYGNIECVLGRTVVANLARGAPLVIVTIAASMFLVSLAFAAVVDDMPPPGPTCYHERSGGSGPSTGSEAIAWGLFPDRVCHYVVAPDGATRTYRKGSLGGPLLGLLVGLVAGGIVYVFARRRWDSH